MKMHRSSTRAQGGKLARDRASKGYFAISGSTGRRKPPSTRVGSQGDITMKQPKGASMKPNKSIVPYPMFAVAIMAAARSAPAQQINGTPGSTSVITTKPSK